MRAISARARSHPIASATALSAGPARYVLGAHQVVVLVPLVGLDKVGEDDKTELVNREGYHLIGREREHPTILAPRESHVAT